jgi:hypothetical protein
MLITSSQLATKMIIYVAIAVAIGALFYGAFALMYWLLPFYDLGVT